MDRTMSVSTETADRSAEYRESNDSTGPDGRLGSVIAGLVGGVIAVLLSILPLSEVLGGAVAGYLDRRSGRRGTAAGVVAGAVASLPYLLVGTYVALSPAIALPGPELALSRELTVAGATGVAFVYVVGLGVLGSLVGAWIHDQR